MQKNTNLKDKAMVRAYLFNGLPVEEKWNLLIKLSLFNRVMTNEDAGKLDKIIITNKGVIYNS